MAKKYQCIYCGGEFSKSKIDWEGSEPEFGDYYCIACSESLVQAGINAMNPNGNGYDEDGIWDEERLGF
ncbi:hypothetical protein [Facklamia sp. 7083-14-GEN3]|uniref:hypothetical protein n=1 Tax=Facklamia sp. 7083-14-GEN3 TaxID=2973478 RepID=UPI00215CAD2C|nr:hypothetical protein [Facklamia sp. 7083-14-GEN3]MCR8968423.1 hypothetical protein [Facklamia sp. 7083-14-GEN3]